MDRSEGEGDPIIRASLGRHLAFAPVAFAVTEGPAHTMVYANAIFRRLQAAGKIRIGASTTAESRSASDLTPLLDSVLRTAKTERDALLQAPDDGAARWSCTVWPVSGTDEILDKLVIEVRDVELVEGAKARQRAIAERLLLGALREQETAKTAVDASARAHYLAQASRDLSLSLDEDATRDTVRHLSLPRPGTWCVVDVLESNGAIHRLAVVHPDPAKAALIEQLEAQWPFTQSEVMGARSVLRSDEPTIITYESGEVLSLAAHGEEDLRLLREIGFGSLLVVPLIVRARVQGAITFVSIVEDPPFTTDEIALAVDLSARCAMALDNARLYREADALRLVAELANKSKAEFLGSMSHELRTPLNAIGGFAELIDMGLQGPVSDEQHAALGRIKANQQHLLMLITEILNFVRVESGRMEYHLDAVSMKQAVADVDTMLCGAIEAKGLRLTLFECDPTVVAWADADRVRQILVNLVMNAVKYTPPDGGEITIECSVLDGMVLTHVRDNGVGIASDKLESIFEPFVQLSATVTDRQGGVGLGLAISRDLAHAMNGDLTATSEAGVGSEFTLSLPAASGETPAALS